MRSTRTVPGRPVNGGAATVQRIRDLIVETLDQSDTIDLQQAGGELDQVAELIGLLALGGHLRENGLVLVSDGLHLTIHVPVGEAALSATEDLRRPRLAQGAASWMLYVPVVDALAGAVADVVEACAHISNESPPDEASAAPKQASASSIDLARLGNLRSSQ